MKIRASAPGTLMLLGEHAVLHNYHALCAAINQRITVTLIPTPGINKIFLKSDLGIFEFSYLDFIKPQEPFSYVIAAIQEYKFSCGFELYIQSDFSSTIGFGSSSAVTIATIAALELLSFKTLNLRRVFFTALKVLRKIQGQGSGTDLAAATYGGIIFYRPYPLIIEKLTQTFPISAIYSGQKTPTREVIHYIEKRRVLDPEHYEDYFKKINQISIQAKTAITHQDLAILGALFNAHEIIMEEMQLSTPAINKIIQATREFNILGAKISGSGLGDCVITLGELPENTFPQDASQKDLGIRQIPVKISPRGVEAERMI